jgi:hypothetical protein
MRFTRSARRVLIAAAMIVTPVLGVTAAHAATLAVGQARPAMALADTPWGAHMTAGSGDTPWGGTPGDTPWGATDNDTPWG